MPDPLRIKALCARVTFPVDEPECSVTKSVDDLARFRRASDIGTSLLPKGPAGLLGAVPIPAMTLPPGEVLELTEAELAEALKKPLSQQVREAIARLGGVDYLIRVGQYDHKTLLSLAKSLEPKELQLGPSESLYDLIKASMSVKVLPIEGEVING